MSKHKHHRRNTEEYIQELQQLHQDSLSPAHKILGLSKNEEDPEVLDEKPKKPHINEQQKVKNALTDLKEDKPNVKGMFSRIYSIPSNSKSKISRMTGQVPRSMNVYGSHYPVARVLNDNKTLVLHTSDYGTDGKTQELIQKIKQEVPSIYPDFKVLELHHPDYKHSAKVMRIKSESNLADYFKHASEKHPDEEYRKHALDAHQHLTKIKKAEYGKPIHSKRVESEGWDGKQNEQKRVNKISEYLQRVGLTPDLDSSEGRKMGEAFPTGLSINPEGDPHDQQLIHEAAHAMLTPTGMSVPQYQDFIGKPGLEGKLKATAYRKEMQEMHGGGLPEQTAQHMEAGIARRSGVEPFRSPKRGVNPQSAEEKSRNFAHKQLGLLDEGIHTFDPFTGEKQYGESVDSLINARARGDKRLIKPVQEKTHQRLKQKKDSEFNAENFLAASEKDIVRPFGQHPRDYYKDKESQKRRKQKEEIQRKKTGAKKPLDAAMDKLNITKGEKGDWKKEGYKTKTYKRNSDDELYIEMLHPHLKNDLGKPLAIAHASFDHRNSAIDVHVHPEHRRKGIASGLYQHAEKVTGERVRSGKTQTPDGRSLWSQSNRPFGKGEGMSSPLKKAIYNLKKTLTAGGGNAAPSMLTGGAALGVEEISGKIEKVNKKTKNKISKSEFDESWFFEDDDSLTKAMPPEEEGVAHPEKPWVSKRHPNGKMMWHSHPEQAKQIDAAINSKQAHAKILNSLKEPHKSAYIEHIRGVIKDPNRHFVPTEEDGVQKLRARHVKSLIDGKGHVTMDTSEPNYLTFNRESHSQGVNRGAIPQIKIPTKKEKV